MKDYFAQSLELHQRLNGKIGTHNKIPVNSKDDLSIAYTPGIARPCEVISQNHQEARKLTIKKNSVAVVSDGSAVLGLGNIGPYGAIPVMEGKALLFKEFANIDAWPICLDTQDTEEIITTIRHLAPVFGGINLEDISAPRCFEIENRLQDLGIPVFHDDQHGTAIVLLAALINASKLKNQSLKDLSIVINGAGAAGTAITRLLRCVGYDPNLCESIKDIIVCDSKGAIHRDRQDLSPSKKELLAYSNRSNKKGSLQEVLVGADAFIGVSKGNLLTAQDIKTMAKNPIILAMANPIPEIMPEEAKSAGAFIVGTGRSDFPNQVNNVLVFPGIFRGALDSESKSIDDHMKIISANALANSVQNLSPEHILPDPLDKSVAQKIAKAISESKKV